MGKDKRQARSGVRRVLEEKKRAMESGSGGVAARAVAADASDPTGSCRYADGVGQMQCESPVPKSYCDGKGGFFIEGGRC